MELEWYRVHRQSVLIASYIDFRLYVSRHSFNESFDASLVG